MVTGIDASILHYNYFLKQQTNHKRKEDALKEVRSSDPKIHADDFYPAERLTELEPAAAAAVPPHVLLRFGVEATTSPAGRLSVNAIPFRPMPVFGF